VLDYRETRFADVVPALDMVVLDTVDGDPRIRSDFGGIVTYADQPRGGGGSEGPILHGGCDYGGPECYRRTGVDSELCAPPSEGGDFGGVDDVLARQPGNVRACSAKRSALHDGCAVACARQGPRQQPASDAAAEDQIFVLFNVRHGRSLSFKNCGARYLAPPDDLTSGKSIGVLATWLR
jgi:hypothetical protein